MQMPLSQTILYLLLFSFLPFGFQSPLFAQQNDSIYLKETFTKIDVLMEAAAYDSVVFYYKKTLLLAQNVEDKNKILSELGYTYALLEDYNESILFFKKAVTHAIENTKDSSFIVDQYYYIAYGFFQLEDFDQALLYSKKALPYNNLNKNSISFAQALNSIAIIYLKKADYDNAIIYEKRALEIFEQYGSPLEIISSKNNLALYYYYKQDYQIALNFAESNIAFFEQAPKDVPISEYISPFNNYVLILIKLKKFDLAQSYLKKILDLYKNSSLEETIEIIYFNQAFLNYEIRRLSTALTQFQENIHLYQKKHPNGHTNIGKAHYYIGKIKAIQGNHHEALQAYQMALQVLVPSFKNHDFSTNPSINKYCRSSRNLLRTLTAKANALSHIHTSHNQQDIDLIFNTYHLAVEVAEQLRQSYKAEGSRYFLAEETAELFSTAVDFAYQLYEQTGEQQYLEKALFYAQKNQAPILLQRQRAIAGQAIGGVPPELIQTEKQLSIDLAYYKNKQALAQEKKDSTKIQLYADYLFSTKQQLEDLQEQLQTNYPRYFDYQYGANTISVAKIQQSLAPQQLFLQYYLTNNQLYIFSITASSADLLTVKDIKDLEVTKNKLIAALQNPLSRALSEQAAYETLTTAAHTLYKNLVEVALDKVKFQVERLSIASNGFLTEIPFEVLLSKVPNGDNINYLSLDYLIKDMAISYQPSAVLMQRLQDQKNRTYSKEVLAIAPFTNEENTAYSALTTRKSLNALPFTTKEIKQLQQLFEVTALRDDTAKKAAFLQLAPDYRILHLATHGVADFKEAAYAHLLFHPDYTTDSAAHILYNYEIQNLQLNAELAVLSACETGAGKVDKGEGLLSLARGFFYTGIPSVIMSKWQINDRSTSLIMNDFYKNLKQEKDKDKALQAAKITYLNTEADLVTAHPFYWAGLVQLGNSESLDFGLGNFRWLVLLGIVCFLGFTAYYLLKK